MLKHLVLALMAMLMLGFTGEASAAMAAEEVHYYTVKPGDMLSAIVKEFCGDYSQYRRIAAENRIGNPDMIQPKKQLKIRCGNQTDNEVREKNVAAPAPTSTPTSAVVLTAVATPRVVYLASDEPALKTVPAPRSRATQALTIAERRSYTQIVPIEKGGIKNRNLAFAPNVTTAKVHIRKGAAVRNNNPGNLRNTDGSWMRFSTPEEGFRALMGYIERAKQGDHGSYHGNQTLHQFFSVYAPSGDRNNPRAYARSVAMRLGVSPNTRIADISTLQLAKEIARHESGVRFGNGYEQDVVPQITTLAQSSYEAMPREAQLPRVVVFYDDEQ